MTQESKLLIGALRRAATEYDRPLSLSADWNRLVQLGRAHKVLPLLYDGLHRDKAAWAAVPEPAKKLLHHEFFKAIHFDEQMEQLTRRLKQELSEAGVSHILLKGAALKYDYPVPALRTMCDVDVLVHAADFPAVERVAKNLGGVAGHSDGNHRNYRFPNGVEVEFHPNLVHQDSPVAARINPGWQYARPENEGGTMTLTPEGAYLHTLCHLADHFAAGGVGVRFVLDVWVSQNRSTPQPDRAVVERELEAIGLLEFACNIEALARWWFGSGESNDLLEELGEYILTSGLHGRGDRATLNAVSLSNGGSRTSALLGKVFYSRQEMEDRYPWCKGKAWLLPAAWCARAFRAVTRHGHLIVRWTRQTGQVSQEEAKKQKERLARFGIKNNRT